MPACYLHAINIIAEKRNSSFRSHKYQHILSHHFFWNVKIKFKTQQQYFVFYLNTDDYIKF